MPRFACIESFACFATLAVTQLALALTKLGILTSCTPALPRLGWHQKATGVTSPGPGGHLSGVQLFVSIDSHARAYVSTI